VTFSKLLEVAEGWSINGINRLQSVNLPAAHPNLDRGADPGVLCLVYGSCAKAVEGGVWEEGNAVMRV
jgi:hypothetical protein